jgi:hypothetical protein
MRLLCDAVSADFAGSSTDDAFFARQVGVILAAHGTNADIVAMTRADALFRRGEDEAARRWLRIFRRIALSPTHTRARAD